MNVTPMPLTPLRGGKYLAFALGAEHYAIGILRVREIIGQMTITHLPSTPDHIKGVINLRGEVIFVLDLRMRLGLEPVEPSEQTCIIVVESRRGGKQLNTGLFVDRVLDVLNIAENHIVDCPDFGTSVERRFVSGMAKTGQAIKILLDIDGILEFPCDQSL